MSTNDMKQRRRATKKKPSAFWKFWNRALPYMVPFILGMMTCCVGHFVLPYVFRPQAAIEQQAALGGAAIPFPSGNPLPSPSSSPPTNSTAVPPPSLWMSTFEPPSQANPPAQNGQKKSERLSRPLLRLTR